MIPREAVKFNTAHINLSLGHDTGAFVCSSLKWYWEHIGRLAHELAGRILLLMDCGGSNSYRSHVFKYHLDQLSTVIGLPIRVAHLPVCCSKYNPIERRVFPHVKRAYSGQIFTSADQMFQAIESRACTSACLETTAHVLFRNASSGRWCGYSRGSGITRKRRCPHDNGLPMGVCRVLCLPDASGGLPDGTSAARQTVPEYASVANNAGPQ